MAAGLAANAGVNGPVLPWPRKRKTSRPPGLSSGLRRQQFHAEVVEIARDSGISFDGRRRIKTAACR